MSRNISIHFKCQDRMYSIMLKTSVEEIKMLMVEARIYKKLCLDESNVKLHLIYIPLRGKIKAVRDMRGSAEDSYRMMYSYLFMLEKVNPGTITNVELDEAGKFMYLFIALGVSIEGFQCMRQVIMVDATFLKNGYGGVLVFAIAQDLNRHIYPIAFGVLDGENNASWAWFSEQLKTVVPDSPGLVFVSDRNASLINAVANMYPGAHYGYCLWHLSQNVKGHAGSGNKFVCAFRFPSASKYMEETTNKATWARVFSLVDKYNLDTSNSVESMNKTFREARRYSLIPLLDTIVRQFSVWFNEHRKEALQEF